MLAIAIGFMHEEDVIANATHTHTSYSSGVYYAVTRELNAFALVMHLQRTTSMYRTILAKAA